MSYCTQRRSLTQYVSRTTQYKVLFCFLRTVFTSALLSIGHTGTVENTTDNMIADTRQVSDSASPNDHRAVFLEIVINSGYISCNLFAVGQSDTSYFTQG